MEWTFLDREVNYMGIHYRVIEDCDNLLLVVKKEDLENEKYPLQVFTIPQQ